MSIALSEEGFSLCRLTGKRSYISQAKAHVYLKRIARKNKQAGDRKPAHVYRCEACCYYHIGHDSQSAKVGARKSYTPVKRTVNATRLGMDYVALLWKLGDCA